MMRLDKFLKVSRLIKRRTLAKEIADSGRILINEKIAKSSSSVRVDDQIRIIYGNKIVDILVTNLSEQANKQNAVLMYRIISEVQNLRKGEDDIENLKKIDE